MRSLRLLGGMGFTVALFVADAAGADDSLRLGAMASFGYIGLAILVGKWLIQSDQRGKDALPTGEPLANSDS